MKSLKKHPVHTCDYYLLRLFLTNTFLKAASENKITVSPKRYLKSQQNIKTLQNSILKFQHIDGSFKLFKECPDNELITLFAIWILHNSQVKFQNELDFSLKWLSEKQSYSSNFKNSLLLLKQLILIICGIQSDFRMVGSDQQKYTLNEIALISMIYSKLQKFDRAVQFCTSLQKAQMHSGCIVEFNNEEDISTSVTTTALSLIAWNLTQEMIFENCRKSAISYILKNISHWTSWPYFTTFLVCLGLYRSPSLNPVIGIEKYKINLHTPISITSHLENTKSLVSTKIDLEPGNNQPLQLSITFQKKSHHELHSAAKPYHSQNHNDHNILIMGHAHPILRYSDPKLLTLQIEKENLVMDEQIKLKCVIEPSHFKKFGFSIAVIDLPGCFQVQPHSFANLSRIENLIDSKIKNSKLIMYWRNFKNTVEFEIFLKAVIEGEFSSNYSTFYEYEDPTNKSFFPGFKIVVNSGYQQNIDREERKVQHNRTSLPIDFTPKQIISTNRKSVGVQDSLIREDPFARKSHISDIAPKIPSLEQQLEKQKMKKQIYKDLYTFTHDPFRCDGCRRLAFAGIRYHCTSCANFDYCEKCYYQFWQQHPPDHTFSQHNPFAIWNKVIRVTPTGHNAFKVRVEIYARESFRILLRPQDIQILNPIILELTEGKKEYSFNFTLEETDPLNVIRQITFRCLRLDSHGYAKRVITVHIN